MQCPFYIKIQANSNGQRLVVKHLSSDHNHEINQVTSFIWLLKTAIFL